MHKGLVFSSFAWLEAFIERRPSVGIAASFSGFGVSLLSLLHIGTVVLGFGGALLGVMAGWYTLRIKKHHWDREKQKRL